MLKNKILTLDETKKIAGGSTADDDLYTYQCYCRQCSYQGDVKDLSTAQDQAFNHVKETGHGDICIRMEDK